MVPPKERYFEDYREGEVFEFGDKLVTEEEIIRFAKEYDPQVFHIDPEAAKSSSFEGLAASGWMTGSIIMRMLVDHYISPLASMGSPGLDEVRWLKPVRPGDRLRARVTVISTRLSQTKPDRGLLQSQTEGLNQRGEVVYRMKGWNMYRVRPK